MAGASGEDDPFAALTSNPFVKPIKREPVLPKSPEFEACAVGIHTAIAGSKLLVEGARAVWGRIRSGIEQEVGALANIGELRIAELVTIIEEAVNSPIETKVEGDEPVGQ